MLSDQDLDTYARHLSLPEVGMQGQDKLLQTHVICMDHAPWAQTFRQALKRAGMRVNDDSTGIAVTHDPALPKNTARVFPGMITLGTIDYSHPATVDHAGPLSVKHLWLGAALASEVMLWVLGHRPDSYWLSLEFPLLAVIKKG